MFASLPSLLHPLVAYTHGFEPEPRRKGPKVGTASQLFTGLPLSDQRVLAAPSSPERSTRVRGIQPCLYRRRSQLPVQCRVARVEPPLPNRLSDRMDHGAESIAWRSGAALLGNLRSASNRSGHGVENDRARAAGKARRPLRRIFRRSEFAKEARADRAQSELAQKECGGVKGVAA